MARNPYFKDYSGEQNVIEDLSIEIIKTMGRDMLYIPREQYSKNIEFGEARYKFTKTFPLEMYIASVGGIEYYPGAEMTFEVYEGMLIGEAQVDIEWRTSYELWLKLPSSYAAYDKNDNYVEVGVFANAVCCRLTTAK